MTRLPCPVSGCHATVEVGKDLSEGLAAIRRHAEEAHAGTVGMAPTELERRRGVGRPIRGGSQ